VCVSMKEHVAVAADVVPPDVGLPAGDDSNSRDSASTDAATPAREAERRSRGTIAA
jgi:hypothetical protein